MGNTALLSEWAPKLSLVHTEHPPEKGPCSLEKGDALTGSINSKMDSLRKTSDVSCLLHVLSHHSGPPRGGHEPADYEAPRRKLRMHKPSYT